MNAKNSELSTTKPAYGSLMFFPVVFFLLGVVVVTSSNNWVITNMGSLNVVLALLYLALIFTDAGNVGLNER